MYTIASLLDIHSEEKVINLWRFLEEKCSLRGIKMTPLPHISWQTAENYQIDKTEQILDNFSKHHRPFTAHITGLGLFTGEKIILYLALVQSGHLKKVHYELWKKLSENGLSYYYSPEYWVPHITLANRDVDQHKIACAIEELAGLPLDFNLTISSIAMLYDNQGELGVNSIHKFKGSDK